VQEIGRTFVSSRLRGESFGMPAKDGGSSLARIVRAAAIGAPFIYSKSTSPCAMQMPAWRAAATFVADGAVMLDQSRPRHPPVGTGPPASATLSVCICVHPWFQLLAHQRSAPPRHGVARSPRRLAKPCTTVACRTKRSKMEPQIHTDAHGWIVPAQTPLATRWISTRDLPQLSNQHRRMPFAVRQLMRCAVCLSFKC
jgi:hypothetical protein